MSRYAVYILNMAGMIDTATDLVCPTDQTAVIEAQRLAAKGMVEVWQGERRVAVIPPSVAKDISTAKQQLASLHA